MHCDLKHTMGVWAECEQVRCVYWRPSDSRSTATGAICVLDEYGLIGELPDRTQKWLLAYKLSADRARMQKILREQRRHRSPLAQNR